MLSLVGGNLLWLLIFLPTLAIEDASPQSLFWLSEASVLTMSKIVFFIKAQGTIIDIIFILLYSSSMTSSLLAIPVTTLYLSKVLVVRIPTYRFETEICNQQGKSQSS